MTLTKKEQGLLKDTGSTFKPDKHKKNDGQSDKRQKNQCQNALPQGDPFCTKKVKKKR